MKILIAENDPETSGTLQSTLNRWGYDVVACADGAQAWQALQQDDPPKLVILERHLPDMDGAEICRNVRNAQSSRYTYIILLTEDKTEENLLAGLEAGADDYIVKPLDPHELRVRLSVANRIVGLQNTFAYVLRLSEFEADHDPLTGLWNRAAIVELLTKESARAGRDHSYLGIIAIGLDQFRFIREEYGRLTSDAVLREIVLRIHSTVRSYDSVGRTEGEDFIIVAPNCSLNDSKALVERLCCSIGQYRAIVGEKSIKLSMSAGILSVDKTTELNPPTLITRVEQALVKAKKKGPGSVELA